MRLEKPRVPPLEPENMDEKTRERFGDVPINIFRTLAHHPELLRRWVVFGNHILNKSTLLARDRELVILRVGWLCRAGYEWAQHVVIGKQAGLSEDEIERIPDGPDAGWSAKDRLLLQASDELHYDHFISDDTWAGLGEHLDTRQLMDLIFTVGQYQLVSMALNSLGVQLDPGLEGLPER